MKQLLERYAAFQYEKDVMSKVAAKKWLHQCYKMSITMQPFKIIKVWHYCSHFLAATLISHLSLSTAWLFWNRYHFFLHLQAPKPFAACGLAYDWNNLDMEDLDNIDLLTFKNRLQNA